MVEILIFWYNYLIKIIISVYKQSQKYMKKLVYSSLALAVFAPAFAFAADAFSILNTVQSILNVIIPIVITIAVIIFIVGVVKYVTASDEEKQAEARKLMISGIIGLFVIVSIWGLVRVLQNTFGVNSDEIPGTPCVVDTNPFLDGCQS